MSLYALVIFFLFYGENCAVPATTVHQIELPDSKSSIKIFEEDTSWHDNDRRIIGIPNGYNRAPSTDRADTTLGESTSEENFNQYALENFLNSYAEKFRRKQLSNSNDNEDDNEKASEEDESTTTSYSTDKEEKSKRWNLMHVQNHKHPFQDKKGWVSLDPVPWSLSKISKWHGEKKPVKKPEMPHYALEKPWEADLVTSEYDDIPSKPSWYQKPRPYKIKPIAQYKPVYNEEQIEQDNYYQVNRPTIVVQEPEFIEPGASYNHKVQIHYNTDSGYEGNKYYTKRPSHHTDRYDSQNHKHCDHHSSEEEIITDGLPTNFPNNPYNRRKSSELPESHPFTGNGDWILLSTTKGYKSPQSRQRSLQISLNSMPTSSDSTRKSIQIIPNSIPSKSEKVKVKQSDQSSLNSVQNEPDSVGLRKGVQLTVLPPLKNSNVNMTTSHGGLLQVESTFETVEQSQQRHARKVNNRIKKNLVKTKGVRNKVIRRPAVQKLNVALPVTSLNERMGRPDISAVLAAAGAGMIPATMAMLVPMALGGKRRRRDIKLQYQPFWN